VCAATASAHGITRIAQPERARLGALVQTVVRAFEGRTSSFRLGDVDVVLQGDVALVGGDAVVLSHRERDLLVALAARPGRVLAEADLLDSLWGGGDPHLVEVTVARFRRASAPPAAPSGRSHDGATCSTVRADVPRLIPQSVARSSARLPPVWTGLGAVESEVATGAATAALPRLPPTLSS